MALNTGDGAILLGLVKVLRSAFGESSDIVVLDRYGSVPQRYYPELTFRQAYAGTSLLARAAQRLDFFNLVPALLHSAGSRAEQRTLAVWLLPRALRQNLDEFRSADLIVSAGGTYLVEHYRLELNLLQLSLAVSTGKATVMFTQSLGPFRRAPAREWVRHLFPRIDRILLRDRRSLENLVEAGVPIDNARLAPDAAFALADVDALTDALAKPMERRRRAAISVRSWSFPGNPTPGEADDRYRAAIAEIAVWLVRHEQMQVTFISTCQGVPEYGFDDSAVARDILSLLPQDVARSVVIDSGFHRPEALRAILKDFDFVIATRMHVAILALCSGTPVLPIAYEFKTKELFDSLGLGEWVLDIDRLDPAASTGIIEQFLAAAEDIRRTMIPRVIERYNGAMAVAGVLREIESERREKAA